ncbi:MAG: hypothetical protein QM774_08960 [Gordonia sp. (in: high G+C Gram-positive bacteria)]|uniref:hypothetical protein n=1 Tax=Gordonia sp. (in: high G+C Gram-positive bacteria) TaxID=84139 RepID=UPI0039E495B9
MTDPQSPDQGGNGQEWSPYPAPDAAVPDASTPDAATPDPTAVPPTTPYTPDPSPQLYSQPTPPVQADGSVPPVPPGVPTYGSAPAQPAAPVPPAVPSYPAAMPGQPYAAAPYGAQPYGVAYPAPNPMGPPPQTGQTSAIVATVISAIMAVTCYGAIVGIVPLIFGILGISKGSSVTNLWNTGQTAAAQKAADDSRKWAMWAWISMGIGLVLFIIAAVVFFVWLDSVDTVSHTTGGYGT